MDSQNNAKLKSLDRALELIDVLERTGKPMSVAELSKHLHVNRTTLYATLNTFVERDYLDKDPITGFYSIGIRPVEIGLGYRKKYPFIQMMDAQAVQLSKKWNLQVNVGVFKAPDKVIVLSAHNPGSAPGTSYLFFPTNVNFPAYASSLGKVFLCEMEDEKLKVTIDQINLIQLTDKTITDKSLLFDHLKELHKKGYCYEDNEFMENVRCIGIGIKDHTKQVVAGMSIVLSPFTTDEQREQIIAELLAIKSLVSFNLGFSNY